MSCLSSDDSPLAIKGCKVIMGLIANRVEWRSPTFSVSSSLQMGTKRCSKSGDIQANGDTS